MPRDVTKIHTTAAQSLLSMDKLAQIITVNSVVQALIRIRMKLARQRHDAHFMRNLVKGAPDPMRLKHDLDGLLPSRKQWKRPGRVIRRALPNDDHYNIALKNATLRGIRSDRPEPWALRLNELISSVIARANNACEHQLQHPAIRILPKFQQVGEGPVEYRIISVYENISDRLILGFVAKYLGRVIDPLLMDCSCAFRRNSVISRNQAVSGIADYLKTRENDVVYAAECDIKGFFDCVRHEVALQAVKRAVDALGQKGIHVDPIALKIVEQYLNGYDYFGYARPLAQKLVDGRKNAKISGVVLSDLQGKGIEALGRTGIPQGGALSPLLANLIMHDVDKAVLGDTPDPDLLYYRYCDDMILLHPDKQLCEAALNRYIVKVKELGFLVHPPEKILRYGSEFFRAKSKMPYRVASSSAGKSASPWVSFLGYQIGYDGQLRVRKDSMERHKQKHTDFTNRLVSYLVAWRAKPLKSNDAIVSAMAWRLVAAGIGKSGLGSAGSNDSHFCWRKAFDLLDASPAATTQMRKLDQHRDRLITRLMAALKSRHPSNYDIKRLEEAKAMSIKLCPKRPLIGRALSYCGSLIGDVPQRLKGRRSGNGSYGREY